ncbi:MAG: hypothetical protein AB7O57_02875 [Hyphomicrobiaceae bacterium]
MSDDVHSLSALETFNVRIADEAAGDAIGYDRLLAANADEAKRLLAAAKASLIGGRQGSPGCYHYIDGIERRLKHALKTA